MFLRIDDDLARTVADVLDLTSDASVETVTSAFRSWLPAGSTAKWRAVDDGHRPPGDDASTALEARLEGALESWSCWPICTALGALLRYLGHDVRLAVEHRRGPGVPAVDFHSVLVVNGDLLDPYLGPSAPVPLGHDVTRQDGWATWVPSDRPDHIGCSGGGSVYRYRQLADRLDLADVRAFLDLSTTHTGVGRRRTAHWIREGRLWTVREDDDGTARLQVTAKGAGPFEQSRSVLATGRYEELVSEIDRPAT